MRTEVMIHATHFLSIRLVSSDCRNRELRDPLLAFSIISEADSHVGGLHPSATAAQQAPTNSVAYGSEHLFPCSYSLAEVAHLGWVVLRLFFFEKTEQEAWLQLELLKPRMGLHLPLLLAASH